MKFRTAAGSERRSSRRKRTRRNRAAARLHFAPVNYLGHFHLNHAVNGLPVEAYFAVGVALPDLWPRFSRRQRIRWRAIRAARPSDAAAVALQAGLLNHVWADARFHACATFNRWQRELARSAALDQAGAALSFLGHATIELVLDQRLLLDDPTLASRFYRTLAGCDLDRVEATLSRIGQGECPGLADALGSFIERGFLRRFVNDEDLLAVIEYIYALCGVAAPSPERIRHAVACAKPLVEPALLWPELAADSALSAMAACNARGDRSD